jgi:hypothetical protein
MVQYLKGLRGKNSKIGTLDPSFKKIFSQEQKIDQLIIERVASVPKSNENLHSIK